MYHADRMVCQEEVIAILHQHTEMLTEQRLLLDGLRHSAKAADLKRSDTLISEPQDGRSVHRVIFGHIVSSVYALAFGRHM